MSESYGSNFKKLYKEKGATALTDLIKVRKSLLIMSCVLGGIEYFHPNVSIEHFFGINISLSNNQVRFALFLIVVYYFVNFIWHVIIDIINNWCESTGVVEDKIREVSNSNFTDDPRVERLSESKAKFSTLYTWFDYKLFDGSNSIDNYCKLIDDKIKIMKDLYDNFCKKIDGLQDCDGVEKEKLCASIKEINVSISKIDIEKLITTNKEDFQSKFHKCIKSKRWDESLDNFDKYFRTLFMLKNVRAIVMDYLIPFVVGVFSIVLYLNDCYLWHLMTYFKIC